MVENIVEHKQHVKYCALIIPKIVKAVQWNHTISWYHMGGSWTATKEPKHASLASTIT